MKCIHLKQKYLKRCQLFSPFLGVLCLSLHTFEIRLPVIMSPVCKLSLRIIRTIQVYCMNVMTYVKALRGGGGFRLGGGTTTGTRKVSL